MSKRPFITIDCETDPFLHGRIPRPFLWGAFDGTTFRTWEQTDEFVAWLKAQEVYAFAHNGGKFDFHFLQAHWSPGATKIINSRIVEIRCGNALLRDSFAIMPVPLSALQKDTINYELFEDGIRQKHMEEIRSYLRGDCVYLYEHCAAYFELAGRKITLASNALASARRLEIDPGRTDKNFDSAFRRFYYGGRCEAFQIGVFNDVQFYDIKSAYPFAMVHNHPTGDARRTTAAFFDDPNRRANCFYDLVCYSERAFPVRERNGGLNFPDAFGTYHVSGWELNAAIENKAIWDIKSLVCYEFYNKINFAPFVEHWFREKELAEKEGRKADRQIAKLMLNSLYGKLAQNPEDFLEYKLVPNNTPCEDGWSLGGEFENVELHQRKKITAENEHFPHYYNVATAASITGFVRAMLFNAIRRAGGGHSVLYCDTDSLFLRGQLECHAGLGGWQHEGTAAQLHIAGKKLYAAEMVGGGRKMATKGCQLSYDDIVAITAGEIREWKSPAPNFRVGSEPRFVVRNIAATGGTTKRKGQKCPKRSLSRKSRPS